MMVSSKPNFFHRVSLMPHEAGGHRKEVGLNRVAPLTHGWGGLEARSRGDEGAQRQRRGRACVKGENVPDRQFTPKALNHAWVADTTYLSTEGGPALLVAILDLFGRRVVGWTVGPKLGR